MLRRCRCCRPPHVDRGAPWRPFHRSWLLALTAGSHEAIVLVKKHQNLNLHRGHPMLSSFKARHGGHLRRQPKNGALAWYASWGGSFLFSWCCLDAITGGVFHELAPSPKSSNHDELIDMLMGDNATTFPYRHNATVGKGTRTSACGLCAKVKEVGSECVCRLKHRL